MKETFSWRGRAVLVTGGTGFIGGHLVNALIAVGARVTLLARSNWSAPGVGPHWREQVEYRSGDLTKPESLAGICAGMDCVFHLAGYAHAKDSSASFAASHHWRITVEGTQALLEQACNAGVKRLVFISSVKAMGEGGEVCLDETSPAMPEDYYGMAKREAERLVLAGARRCALHAAVLRLPMVYGRYNAGNLPRMIIAIARRRFPPLPDTHNRRSMVHVDDVIQALFLVAAHTSANGETYIVTDDEAYSARRIYTSICTALGRRPPAWQVPVGLLGAAGRIGDVLQALGLPAPVTSDALGKLLGSAWYSCEKAKRDLGYRPRRKLEDALVEMLPPSA